MPSYKVTTPEGKKFKLTFSYAPEKSELENFAWILTRGKSNEPAPEIPEFRNIQPETATTTPEDMLAAQRPPEELAQAARGEVPYEVLSSAQELAVMGPKALQPPTLGEIAAGPAALKARAFQDEAEKAAERAQLWGGAERAASDVLTMVEGATTKLPEAIGHISDQLARLVGLKTTTAELRALGADTARRFAEAWGPALAKYIPAVDPQKRLGIAKGLLENAAGFAMSPDIAPLIAASATGRGAGTAIGAVFSSDLLQGAAESLQAAQKAAEQGDTEAAARLQTSAAVQGLLGLGIPLGALRTKVPESPKPLPSTHVLDIADAEMQRINYEASKVVPELRTEEEAIRGGKPVYEVMVQLPPRREPTVAPAPSYEAGTVQLEPAPTFVERRPGFLETAEERVQRRALERSMAEAEQVQAAGEVAPLTEEVGPQPPISRELAERQRRAALIERAVSGQPTIIEPPERPLIVPSERVGTPRERIRIGKEVAYATEERKIAESNQPEHPGIPQGANVPENAPEVRQKESERPSGGGGAASRGPEPTPAPQQAGAVPQVAEPVSDAVRKAIEVAEYWEQRADTYRETDRGVAPGGATGKAIGGTFTEINVRNALKKAKAARELAEKAQRGELPPQGIAEIEKRWKALPSEYRKARAAERESAKRAEVTGANINRPETKPESDLRAELERAGVTVPEGVRVQYYGENGIKPGTFTVRGEFADGTSWYLPEFDPKKETLEQALARTGQKPTAPAVGETAVAPETRPDTAAAEAPTEPYQRKTPAKGTPERMALEEERRKARKTLDDLGAKHKELLSQLENAKRGSKRWKEIHAQLAEVSSKIDAAMEAYDAVDATVRMAESEDRLTSKNPIAAAWERARLGDKTAYERAEREWMGEAKRQGLNELEAGNAFLREWDTLAYEEKSLPELVAKHVEWYAAERRAKEFLRKVDELRYLPEEERRFAKALAERSKYAPADLEAEYRRLKELSEEYTAVREKERAREEEQERQRNVEKAKQILATPESQWLGLVSQFSWPHVYETKKRALNFLDSLHSEYRPKEELTIYKSPDGKRWYVWYTRDAAVRWAKQILAEAEKKPEAGPEGPAKPEAPSGASKERPVAEQPSSTAGQQLGIVHPAVAFVHNALRRAGFQGDIVGWLQRKGWIAGPKPPGGPLPLTGLDLPPLPPMHDLKSEIYARGIERIPVLGRLISPGRFMGVFMHPADLALSAANMMKSIVNGHAQWMAYKYRELAAAFGPDKKGNYNPEMLAAARKVYNALTEGGNFDDFIKEHKLGEIASDIIEAHLRSPNLFPLPKRISELAIQYANDIEGLVRYLAEKEGVERAGEVMDVNMENRGPLGTIVHFPRLALFEPAPRAGVPIVAVPSAVGTHMRFRRSPTQVGAIESGVKYASDLRVVIAHEIRSLYDTAINKRLLSEPSLQGLTVKDYRRQLIESAFPQLADARRAIENATSPEQAKAAQKAYRKLDSDLKEKYPTQFEAIEEHAQLGPPGFYRPERGAFSQRFYDYETAKKIVKWVSAERRGTIKAFLEANDASKLAMLSLDVSQNATLAVLGAAWLLVRGRIGEYFKACAFGFYAIFRNPDYLDELLKRGKDWDKLAREMSEMGFPLGEPIEYLQAARMSNIFTKAAYFGEAFRRSSAGFSATLDYLALTMWQTMRESYHDSQGRLNAFRGLEDLRNLLGQARLDLMGWSRGARDVASILMLAPRYYVASANALANIFASAPTASHARQAVTTMMISWIGLAFVTDLLQGSSPEETMRRFSKGNFDVIVRTRWGSFHIGFSHVILSWLKLGMRLADWERRGKSIREGGIDNPIIRWLWGHAGPLVSGPWEFAIGEDYLGRKVNLVDLIMRRATPLGIVSMGEAYDEDTMPAMVAAGALTPLGLNVYSQKYWEDVVEKQNAIARKQYGVLFDELPIARMAEVYRKALPQVTAPKKFERTPGLERKRRQAEFDRVREVRQAAPPEVRDLVDSYQLDLGGYNPTIHFGSGKSAVDILMPDKFREMYLRNLGDLMGKYLLPQLKREGFDSKRPEQKEARVREVMARLRERAMIMTRQQWDKQAYAQRLEAK